VASLGIDGGASSAKWVLLNRSNSTIIQRGVSEAIDGHLYRPESRKRFKEFLLEVHNILGSHKVDAVTLGITGYGSPDLIHELILEVFPQSDVKSSTDVELAYRGEFEVGEGILLYAGTGSIAIHIDKDEKEFTTGGWGYLLGDEGGGFWIGREALRHLAENSESGRTLDEFSHVIASRIGGSTWNDIRAFTYSVNRSDIAQLSKEVVALAEKKEKSAVQIIQKSCLELATLVKKMEQRLGKSEMPVRFGGGISQSSPLFQSFLEEYVGHKIDMSSGDYALTAAKLGIKRLGISSQG
jgi:glucosamine kinase